MRITTAFIILILLSILVPPSVFAASSNVEITQFTSSALNTLTIVASLVATFFLLQGGYIYITLLENQMHLTMQRRQFTNALIGLVLVLSANTIVSLLTGAFTTPSIPLDATQLTLRPIEPVAQTGGLAQVLTDAIASLLQNIIQSATRPITDGIVNF
jgi:hypothetical protein